MKFLVDFGNASAKAIKGYNVKCNEFKELLSSCNDASIG